MSKRDLVIGIDLGTTNSCVAIYEHGQAQVIQNAEGKRTTPSIVGFSKSGEVLVGEAAKRQIVTNPTNTIFSAKRFIGSTFAERATEAKRMPYNVKQSSAGAVVFDVNGKELTPQEISSKVLLKMKQTAEDYTGEKISKAIITVPAYFSNSQRQATKDAAEIAGLEVLRLINEPTAAALAYGLDKKKSGKIFVTDIGGGTTDFSCLDISDGVVEVLSTSGDAHLAGDNLDEVLVDYLLKTFKDQSGIDVSKDSMALQRLKEAAEKAKIELSSAHQTEINLPFLSANQEGPKHLALTLSRSEFEKMITPLIDKMFLPCKQALQDAKLAPSDIDEVILVGGSTRVPLIQQRVKDIFGKEPSKGVNPDEVVALGAAIQGGVLRGEVNDVLLLDVLSLSLGLETLGGVMTTLIERNTTIPTRKTQVFSTAADNQSAVTVNVFQGERAMVVDNTKLASFTLTDIPPAPRGVPQIEIMFDVTTDGIINVSAKDLGTNKEQKITVSSATKLDKSEIERMVREAEANAEADKQKRELVEVKNQLSTMIFHGEKLIKDHPGKNFETLSQELEKAQQLTNSDNLEEIKNGLQLLQTQVHKVTEELYKQNAQPESPKDDVVDAEYEDSSKS
jgi:molecular chaperone DnaK